jgi:hypothetical protein
MPRELPIPAAAVADENSLELVRVWAALNEQHVVRKAFDAEWSTPGTDRGSVVQLAVLRSAA